MKTKPLSVLIAFSFLLFFSACAKPVLIIQGSNQQTLSQEELFAKIPSPAILVLGEFHYTPAIQEAQASVIEGVVRQNKLSNQFTVGWEFLNYSQQEEINKTFQQYKDKQISGEETLKILFPKAKNPASNHPYLPLFAVTKKFDGQLIGVNAPREVKRQLMKNGTSALEPQDMPPDFQKGSENYLARFKETMGDHVAGEELQSYYLAQCYTDHVMAHYLIQDASHPSKFLVVGSFHSDYRDGVVPRLKEKSKIPVISFKFVDSLELSQEELNQKIQNHEKYGPIADYIFITNPPPQ